MGRRPCQVDRRELQLRRIELRLTSPLAQPQTSSWNDGRRNGAQFVPGCDFKECQKLINILELGVCQRQARSSRHLFCLLSEGNRCSHMKENFISKIAFSILALLEAFSDRNSHVIIHRSYWKLLKLIHWDIWCLWEGRSRKGLPDLNRIICKKQISVATAWIDLFLGFIIQFTMRAAHMFTAFLCWKTSWSLFLQWNHPKNVPIKREERVFSSLVLICDHPGWTQTPSELQRLCFCSFYLSFSNHVIKMLPAT